MDSTNSIIKTDNITGTKSSNYNNGTGYKGTGVKIGIIEAEGGMYEQNAAQLQSIHGSRLHYIGCFDDGIVSADIPDDHPTKVTSIIVGQSCELNGTTYEGIVPNATTYPHTTKYSPFKTLLRGRFYVCVKNFEKPLAVLKEICYNALDIDK